LQDGIRFGRIGVHRGRWIGGMDTYINVDMKYSIDQEEPQMVHVNNLTRVVCVGSRQISGRDMFHLRIEFSFSSRRRR